MQGPRDSGEQNRAILLQQAQLGQPGQAVQQGLQAVIAQDLAGQSVKDSI